MGKRETASLLLTFPKKVSLQNDGFLWKNDRYRLSIFQNMQRGDTISAKSVLIAILLSKVLIDHIEAKRPGNLTSYLPASSTYAPLVI